MTGISEILVLVLLIACIVILPRLFKGEPVKKRSSSIPIKKLTTQLRVGIILTVLFPVILALYLKPWNGHLVTYLSIGILPVFIGWAIVWILAGLKK